MDTLSASLAICDSVDSPNKWASNGELYTLLNQQSSCQLVTPKPVPDPMMTYFYLYLTWINLYKIWITYNSFFIKKKQLKMFA